jgi:hypothetical protein
MPRRERQVHWLGHLARLGTCPPAPPLLRHLTWPGGGRGRFATGAPRRPAGRAGASHTIAGSPSSFSTGRLSSLLACSMSALAARRCRATAFTASRSASPCLSLCARCPAIPDRRSTRFESANSP